ncbi:MAG: hypothetical protein KKD99_06695 [Proteobacteria bacterium]|nr:hypothetical protein [Pseudomonadota bacterium]MBU4356071.1 hypothetical protein [Pseudomonadota bacterium]MBU4448256.1 hypothetical protein [Pseudomonadota bacterium]MCG2773633.1 abortive infection system antitoxin AbiGi family protein [Desulfobacterales bacterium]
MNFDRAVHSGFLIHWTGKDIDCLHDPRWHETDKSKTNEACNAAYINRLHNILKYGLWMTEEQRNNLSIPTVPQACFTELKLSESRKHAKRYGRLGIGVKRPFVFQRLGRPLIYYHHKKLKYDKFLKACFDKLLNDNDNKYLLNYFKQMNSSDILNYDFYGESEWRIIFSKELLGRYIIDPNDEINIKEHKYFDKLSIIEKNKLRYLIPLDYLFSMIIYPSLEVKNMAYQSDDIRYLIKEIKERKFSNHFIKDESKNMPIELDLDACRNF